MKLIVETDLGHDPDDFFAICWLISVGVDIKAITLVPGEPRQIAIVRFLQQQLGLNFPVGVSKPNKIFKEFDNDVHAALLKKYGFSQQAQHDGPGEEIVTQVYKEYPDSELFIIGPVSSVGRFLKASPEARISRATMQGGFLGYDLHNYPCVRLDKFEGKTWCPTFNLNGDRPAGLWFMDAEIAERRFVPKSLTHSVVYDGSIQKRLKPTNRAAELFKEGMDLYLERHPDKKFHDPTAAVCHLCPEIASWVRGRVIKIESGWGTVLDENGDYIAADIDRDKFWHCITNFERLVC